MTNKYSYYYSFSFKQASISSVKSFLLLKREREKKIINKKYVKKKIFTDINLALICRKPEIDFLVETYHSMAWPRTEFTVLYKRPLRHGASNAIRQELPEPLGGSRDIFRTDRRWAIDSILFPLNSLIGAIVKGKFPRRGRPEVGWAFVRTSVIWSLN